MLSLEERQAITDQVGNNLRTLQIIIVALVLGPLAYVPFVLLMAADAGENEQDLTFVLIGAGMAFAATVARIFMPPVVTKAGLTSLRGVPEGDPGGALKKDAEQLFALYQTKMIIGAAFLEGGAFVNLVAYHMEQHIASLVLAAAMIIGTALSFPTMDRVISWIENHLLSLRQQRGTV